jgi:hypothetical protein
MKRRRWYFGNFSVLATSKEDALEQAMQQHTFQYQEWVTWPRS